MTKYTNDEIEFIIDKGIDIKNRVIFWGREAVIGDIEDSNAFHELTVGRTIRQLHVLTSMNHQPITLRVNSGGGELASAFQLIDEILRNPCQIKFEGSGDICSAATLLMAVCDERWLHKNTMVMVHELSGGTWGKRSNMEVDSKMFKELAAKMVEVYEANSIMAASFWEDVIGSGRDVWLTPEETVTLGLADDIIDPVKRGNLRKKRAAHLAKKHAPQKLNKLSQKVFQRANIKSAIKEVQAHVPAADASDPNIIIEIASPEVESNEPIV